MGREGYHRPSRPKVRSYKKSSNFTVPFNNRSGTLTQLFHRDRLGQIARLVHVGAAQHGDVVGQKLQRDGENNRRADAPHMRGHGDDVNAIALHKSCVFVGKHKQFAAACAHFFQVGFELGLEIILRRNGDDGHVLVHQRQRAVLELAGRVGFGVDVGNLLEFESAL